MKYSLVLKFKDGMIVEQEHDTNEEQITGSGDLLRTLLNGKENNKEIRLENGKVVRNFSDLKSFEIVFKD